METGHHEAVTVLSWRALHLRQSCEKRYSHWGFSIAASKPAAEVEAKAKAKACAATSRYGPAAKPSRQGFAMREDRDTAVTHPTFQLMLLGRSRVLVAGSERSITAAKQLLLLARLARTPDHAATREQLASFLWPGSSSGKARASLRQALNRLRATLEGPVEPFEVDLGSVALRRNVWATDLDMLGATEAAIDPRGSFLDGLQVREPEIEAWLETERRAVAALVEVGLRNSIHARVAEDGPASAIPLALRLVAIAPLNEHDHRLLMRIYHQAGQRSQALGQYERLKAVLFEEIGEVPDRESRQLAEEIRRGAPPGTATEPPRLVPHIGARDAEGPEVPAHSDATHSVCRDFARSGEAGRARRAGPRRWQVVTALAASVAVVSAGLWWMQPRQAATPTASEARMHYPLPQRPSIAVLPFANLTFDSVPDVVIDGLVEEIIASLAKIPQIFVISGQSTFAYKGREVVLADVAETLGVRFVMDGSVRGSHEQMRITASLADALDGRQVWAERYDRTLGDVLALQSEIARRIVAELNVELVSGELARLQQSTTADSEAYSLFLKAQMAPRSSREDVLRRIRLYEDSLARDPDFAAALAAWAIDLARMGRTGLADRDLVYPQAEAIARRAIEAGPGYSGGYLSLSTVYRFRGEFERSLALVEQALSIAPNDADAIMYKGRMLRLLPGRAEEAIATIEQAMRLNPFYPPDYLSQLSWAYFAAGRYREAHETALAYAELRPNHDHAHWRMAMTYSILGEPEKAAQEMATTLRLNPSRTITAIREASPYSTSNAALMSAEIAAMRAAGFPEE